MKKLNKLSQVIAVFVCVFLSCASPPPKQGQEGTSCYPNGTCDGDLTCNSSQTCTKKAVAECTSGEKRCEGNTAVVCNNQGRLEKTNCASDERCKEGTCEKVCVVGSKECITLAKMRKCETGGSWVEVRCASDEICTKGSCQKSTKCVSGTKECLNGKAIRSCKADGNWEVLPCKNNEKCDQGTCKGDDSEEYFVKNSKEGEPQGGGDTRTLNNGNCMELPLRVYNITGYHHGSPVGSGKVHAGDDVNGSAGTSVYAVWNGTVIVARKISTWGTLVEIEHTAPNGEKFVSLYGHLRESDLAVSAGQQVAKGTRLGALGTRLENGGWPEHLHFSIFTGNLPANKVLAGHVKALTGFEDPIPWMNANGVSSGSSCSVTNKAPEVTSLSCTNYNRGEPSTCTLTGNNFTSGGKAWVAFLDISGQKRDSDTSWTLTGKWNCDPSTSGIEANVSGSSGNYKSNKKLQGSCQNSCPGTCIPGQSRSCTGTCGNGTQTCTSSCQWGNCSAPNSGACAPGQSRSCTGTCGSGTQTCTSSCQWGSCSAPNSGACTPGQSRPCTGTCGSGTQTCTSSCQWGSCSAPNSGACTPGQSRSCTGTCGNGTQTCTSSCQWGSCSANNSSPSVTSVTPSNAYLGRLQTFVIIGSCLPSTIAPFIPECAGLVVTSRQSTQAQFRCTPSYSTGNKSGLVKDRPGGTTLRNFNVNVQCGSYSESTKVTGISPTTVYLNSRTTFTVSGTCLPSNMASFIAECANITSPSVNSSRTRATFTCTPSYSRGSKSGVLKDRPGGTSWSHNFTVTVR